MLETSLINVFLNRQNFDNYFRFIESKSLAQESIVILKAVKKYFVEFKDQKQIDVGDFSSYFFVNLHPTWDERKVKEYKELFDLVAKSTDYTNAESLVRGFQKQEFYNALKVELDNNVELTDLESKVSSFVQKIPTNVVTEPDMDIDNAIESTDRSKGLKWRCRALDEFFSHGGPIRGDFLLVAGYVDSGKSSFAVSEASFMAQQLEGDDYVLYLSNESEWQRYLNRVYCATLNKTIDQITKNKELAKQTYLNKMHGNKNRLKILNIQGWSAKDVENRIKKHVPKLIVLDMIDKINGFDSFSNKENGGEKYQKLYDWCLETAVKYCPVIGVSQLNGDGEDEMYPNITSLRYSRVDKQAAATLMIMVGHQAGNNKTRYLSCPKNKINSNKSWKAIVKFDPDTSRFE